REDPGGNAPVQEASPSTRVGPGEGVKVRSAPEAFSTRLRRHPSARRSSRRHTGFQTLTRTPSKYRGISADPPRRLLWGRPHSQGRTERWTPDISTVW